MSFAPTQSIVQSVGTLLHGIVDANSISKVLSEKCVSNLTLDSRQSAVGTLFAAIPGQLTDGRQFAEQAIACGAEGVLFEPKEAPEVCLALEKQDKAVSVAGLSQQISLIASRLFSHPSQQLKVIGITGTNGKTTCATLLQQSLERLGVQCALMGTLGASFKGELQDTGLTTADPVAIQRTLRGFKEQGAEAVCMEVSSHGLDQDRVKAVEFKVAVFTNLSQDHLDYHETMSTYGAAKKKLFDFRGLDTIVVNADDALGQEILSVNRPCRVITYGITDADVCPVDCAFSEKGIEFSLTWEGQTTRLHAPLFGEINLPNLLATAATLLTLGYSLSDLAKVFPSLTPPPGRMERFHGADNKPTIVVDYSHTPDSLQRALDGLGAFTSGKVWAVFGCGGDRDKGKRPMMGQVAEQSADVVVVTNDNPRCENPEQIARDIAVGFSGDQETILTILDRRQAIQYAIENAGASDIVLVAGKGHESTQTIGTQVLPFSDREVVRELLEVQQ